MKKSLLRAVSRAYHLQCSYKNVNGEIVWSPEKTLIKLLEDLSKTKVETDLDLERLWQNKLNARYIEKLPRSLVFWNGVSHYFQIYSEKSLEHNMSVVLENVDCLTKKKVDLVIKHSRKTIRGYKTIVKLSDSLDVGYYKLMINLDNEDVSCFVIAAPEKISSDTKKSWGPFVPLYALRSDSDWGIGSFKELKSLSKIVKDNGGAWMGMLPMLASNFDYEDCDPSPYSSLSRLFWNEIYLDVEDLVKKYNRQDLMEKISSSDFQEKLKALRNLEYVDYFRVYQTKKEILMELAKVFFANKSHLLPDYQIFEKENPEIDAYAKFRSPLLEEQNYHSFVQYEMNLALKNFYAETGVGLYMDYPVGVNDAGFDYKEMRNVFFGEVSVGAPPEPVFALGQDWGFPAFHPEEMINDSYQYFRKSLRHHLKYSKILRLDHIMGLFRIYSVPKKFKGNEGVYLRFPLEDLFAVVITEAHKLGVDLIGENLGTVPMAVDKIISERNLNGMWVLQCETWRKPKEALDAIPANALLCINTHDMPMLKSFREGTDLALVESLNILSHDYRVKFEKERKEQMLIWEKEFSKENFTVNVISAIAKSEGKYFVLNLEDLMNEVRPQNIPGTWKEYPNWRKKFSLKIEDFCSMSEFVAALKVLKEMRS